MLSPLHDALNATLAETIKSPTSLPTFRTCTTSGYAVNLSGQPPPKEPLENPLRRVVYRRELHAGVDPITHGLLVDGGTAVYVHAGSVLPPGADCVLPPGSVGEVRTLGSDPDEPPNEIELRRDTVGRLETKDGTASRFVRHVGDDVPGGKELLPAGHVLNVNSIALLASYGIFLVRVYLQPTVGLLAVGDELVDSGGQLTSSVGRVRDANRVVLLALFNQLRIACTDYGIVSETAGAVSNKLAEITRKCDVIIVTGHFASRIDSPVRAMLADSGRVKFGRVALSDPSASGMTLVTCSPASFIATGSKDAKAPAFAPVPEARATAHSPRLLFVLPGTPCACQAAVHLLVHPALKKMRGVTERDCLPLAIDVVIEGELQPSPFQHGADPNSSDVRMLSVRFDRATGKFKGRSAGEQVTSKVTTMLNANALLRTKVGDSTPRAGATVQCIILDGGGIEQLFSQSSSVVDFDKLWGPKVDNSVSLFEPVRYVDANAAIAGSLAPRPVASPTPVKAPAPAPSPTAPAPAPSPAAPAPAPAPAAPEPAPAPEPERQVSAPPVSVPTPPSPKAAAPSPAASAPAPASAAADRDVSPARSVPPPIPVRRVYGNPPPTSDTATSGGGGVKSMAGAFGGGGVGGGVGAGASSASNGSAGDRPQSVSVKKIWPPVKTT